METLEIYQSSNGIHRYMERNIGKQGDGVRVGFHLIPFGMRSPEKGLFKGDDFKIIKGIKICFARILYFIFLIDMSISSINL